MIRAMGHGASAEAAARYAAAGQLGVEPFEISPSQCRELRAEAKRRRRRPAKGKVTGNGAHAAVAAETTPEQPARLTPDEERSLATYRAVIARVEELGANATAKDLHALERAQQSIDRLDKQAARRRREHDPQEPERPEQLGEGADRHELVRQLLAKIKGADDRRERPDDRRHELSRRWVRACITIEKPEGGDYLRRAGLLEARLTRKFEDEWQTLRDDADRHEHLDREEAELEELEARVQELESAAARAA